MNDGTDKEQRRSKGAEAFHVPKEQERSKEAKAFQVPGNQERRERSKEVEASQEGGFNLHIFFLHIIDSRSETWRLQ